MLIIVDYDAGNLRSVLRACEHVGIDARISADPADVLGADRLIFPGVGSAESAVDTLRTRGLDEAIKGFFKTGKPMLGICLGSQIVLDFSAEGARDCLGLVPGVVQKFDLPDKALKVPHIGWNEVDFVKPHPLLKRVSSGDEFYFVHSYYTVPESTHDVYGTTDYGQQFCSMLGRDNLFATQFHLEKSGEKGLSILAEFGQWDGGV
ncbi:MAG: glutamine amidotransferase [Candidatus Azotimanducaceae bacterium]|jgi:glutamine amidotransferase